MHSSSPDGSYPSSSHPRPSHPSPSHAVSSRAVPVRRESLAQCPMCSFVLRGSRFTGYTCGRCSAHFSAKFIAHMRRNHVKELINRHFGPVAHEGAASSSGPMSVSSAPLSSAIFKEPVLRPINVERARVAIEDTDGMIERAMARSQSSDDDAAEVMVSPDSSPSDDLCSDIEYLTLPLNIASTSPKRARAPAPTKIQDTTAKQDRTTMRDTTAMPDITTMRNIATTRTRLLLSKQSPISRDLPLRKSSVKKRSRKSPTKKTSARRRPKARTSTRSDRTKNARTARSTATRRRR